MSTITESKNILALDIGYSATKMSSKTITDFSDTALFKELQSIKVISIPGGIAPLGQIDSGLSGVDYPVVTVDGQRYNTGLSHAVTSSDRTMSNRFVKTEEWKARFRSAISYANFENDVIDKLVLGLPCEHYYDQANPAADSQLVRYLKQYCVGEILVDRDGESGKEKKVTIREVIVIPQPQGTYLGMISMEDNDELRQLAQQQRIMVLDVGYCTFDWILMDGLIVRTDLSGSAHLSYSDVLKGAANDLNHQSAEENNGRSFNYKHEDIEAAAFKGQSTILGFRKTLYDIVEPLDKHARRVFAQVVKKIDPAIEANPVAAVILTGGGASTFEPVVREWAYDECGFELFSPDEPALLNARGYMAKAIMG